MKTFSDQLHEFLGFPNPHKVVGDTAAQLGYPEDKKIRLYKAFSPVADNMKGLTKLQLLDRLEVFFEEFEKSESKETK